MSVKGVDEDARWFAGKGRAVAAVADVGGAGGLRLLDVRYADGGSERYLDLAADVAWAPLLAALLRAPARGDGGRLELRPDPALDELLDPAAAATIPATDQSNTLV